MSRLSMHSRNNSDSGSPAHIVSESADTVARRYCNQSAYRPVTVIRAHRLSISNTAAMNLIVSGPRCQVPRDIVSPLRPAAPRDTAGDLHAAPRDTAGDLHATPRDTAGDLHVRTVEAIGTVHLCDVTGAGGAEAGSRRGAGRPGQGRAAPDEAARGRMRPHDVHRCSVGPAGSGVGQRSLLAATGAALPDLSRTLRWHEQPP